MSVTQVYQQCLLFLKDSYYAVSMLETEFCTEKKNPKHCLAQNFPDLSDQEQSPPTTTFIPEDLVVHQITMRGEFLGGIFWNVRSGHVVMENKLGHIQKDWGLNQTWVISEQG